MNHFVLTLVSIFLHHRWQKPIQDFPMQSDYTSKTFITPWCRLFWANPFGVFVRLFIFFVVFRLGFVSFGPLFGLRAFFVIVGFLLGLRVLVTVEALGALRDFGAFAGSVTVFLDPVLGDGPLSFGCFSRFVVGCFLGPFVDKLGPPGRGLSLYFCFCHTGLYFAIQ